MQGLLRYIQCPGMRVRKECGAFGCRTHLISENILQAEQRRENAWEKRRRHRGARSIVGTRVDKPREVRRLGGTSEAEKCL
jgi:hypothetical protein